MKTFWAVTEITFPAYRVTVEVVELEDSWQLRADGTEDDLGRKIYRSESWAYTAACVLYEIHILNCLKVSNEYAKLAMRSPSILVADLTLKSHLRRD
jgi:hypothetical protein